MARFHGKLAEIHENIKDSTDYITTKVIIELMDNLEREMKKRGITKSELAHRLGKSRSYVSKLLLGYYENITIGTLVKIAVALGEKPQGFKDLARVFGYPPEDLQLFEVELECEDSVSYEGQPYAA